MPIPVCFGQVKGIFSQFECIVVFRYLPWFEFDFQGGAARALGTEELVRAVDVYIFNVVAQLWEVFRREIELQLVELEVVNLHMAQFFRFYCRTWIEFVPPPLLYESAHILVTCKPGMDRWNRNIHFKFFG